MSLDALLIHNVYLQSKTTSNDAWGESIETWTTSSTATKCRMSPISNEMRMQSMGRFENVDYEAFFASGTNITTNNRVVYDGNTYLVRGVKKDSINHHIEALLEVLQ